MRKLAIALLALSLCFQMPLQAAYLTNVPQSLKQPDGKMLNCFATGDEFHNWLHDANNYTIMQNPETGYYVYAIKSGQKLIPSSWVAGQVDPSLMGIQPGLNLDPSEVKALVAEKFKAPELKGFNGSANVGSFNNIVVFIRFSDQSEYTTTTETYNSAFNASSGVSMAEYFKTVSSSQLSIHTTFYPAASGTTVVSYQDAHPRAYYLAYSTTNTIGYNSNERTDREMTLLKNAIESVKSQIEATGLDYDLNNDGQIDNVCFIIQGASAGWSDLLWPHKWSLYSYTVQVAGLRVYSFNFQLSQSFGVSVLCHEMSHSLGFPDLYHYTTSAITPVGSWDVMASNGTPPQHQSAYTKMKYGKWVSSIPVISTPGTYTLEPLSTNPYAAYKIKSPNSSTEFFVVEYRRKVGTFEVSVPGSGLIIYRVNTAFNGNADGPPDEIYVYRPNGTTTVNGTLGSAYFSAGSGRTAFTATSNPSCFLSDGSPGGIEITDIGEAGETISFKFAYPAPSATLAVTPSVRNIGYESTTTSFAVSNTGNATMPWTAAVASTASGWLHITSGASGTDDGSITVLADTHSGSQSRTGSITITSPGANGSPMVVNVIQSGNPPIMILTPETREVDCASGASYFDVSNIGGGTMSWTAVVNAGSSWLHIGTDTHGVDSGRIQFTYDANEQNSSRTGEILITSVGATNSPKTVTVKQSGNVATLSVSPEIQQVASGASTVTCSVVNLGNTTMSWSAAVKSGNSWAHIASGASGSNNGTITINLDANLANDDRTASIVVTAPGAVGSPKTVSIVQKSSPPVMSVLPANRPVDFEANLVTFLVSNEGAGSMNWSASVTQGAEWIRITAGKTGSNDGTITAVVDNNGENDTRTGEITITADDTNGSPQTVTITQYADLSGIDLTKTETQFRIYPNPATDQVTVKLKDYQGFTKKLEVLNIMGQTECIQILEKESTIIDMNKWEKGIYFFRLMSENQVPAVIKVIKN